MHETENPSPESASPYLGTDNFGHQVFVGDVLLGILQVGKFNLSVARTTDQMPGGPVKQCLDLDYSYESILRWQVRTLKEANRNTLLSSISAEYSPGQAVVFGSSGKRVSVDEGQTVYAVLNFEHYFISYIKGELFFTVPNLTSVVEPIVAEPAEKIISRELIVQKLREDFPWLIVADIFNSDGSVNSQLALSEAKMQLERGVEYDPNIKRIAKLFGKEHTRYASQLVERVAKFLINGPAKDDQTEQYRLLIVFFAARDWARWVELAAWAQAKDQAEEIADAGQLDDQQLDNQSLVQLKQAQVAQVRVTLASMTISERRTLWVYIKDKYQRVFKRLIEPSMSWLEEVIPQLKEKLFKDPLFFGTDETYFF